MICRRDVSNILKKKYFTFFLFEALYQGFMFAFFESQTAHHPWW